MEPLMTALRDEEHPYRSTWRTLWAKKRTGPRVPVLRIHKQSGLLQDTEDGLGTAKFTVPPLPGRATWDFASNAVQVTFVK